MDQTALFALLSHDPVARHAAQRYVSAVVREEQADSDFLANFAPAAASGGGLEKYSPDQPRDDHGRWTEGEGFGAAEKDSLLSRLASARRDTGIADQRVDEAYSRTIPQAGRAALQAYSRTNGYALINCCSRGTCECSPKAIAQARDIDRVMAKAAEPTDQTVYRGFALERTTAKQLETAFKAGKNIDLVDRGFLSTTKDDENARMLAAVQMRRTGVSAEILVPKGAPSIDMNRAGTALNLGETEVLLARNSRLSILSLRREPDRTLRVQAVYRPGPLQKAAVTVIAADHELAQSLLHQKFVSVPDVIIHEADLEKYSPDQPRDDHGRWSEEDGGGGAQPQKGGTLVWHGTDEDFERFDPAKQGSGAVANRWAVDPQHGGFYLTTSKEHAGMFGDPKRFAISPEAHLLHRDAAGELHGWAKENGYQSAQDMIDQYYDGSAYSALDADNYFMDAVRDARAAGADGVKITFGDLTNHPLNSREKRLGDVFIMTNPNMVTRVPDADANFAPAAASGGGLEKYSPDQPRDGHGRWSEEDGGGVPLEPGKTPIPESRVRRFHVTSTDNIQNIREHGLRMQDARGIEGPRAVYSWSSIDDAAAYGTGDKKAIVEFHDDPAHYNANPYASIADVPPENIVAIHEPWHDTYRYVKENQLPMRDVERNKDAGEQYARTYERLKAEGYTGRPD